MLLGLIVLVFLLGFTAFLSTLHWPSGSVDLGHCGISFFGTSHPVRTVGWLTGLLGEKVVPDLMFGLVVLFLFSSVPVSEGMEIRHGCQFLSSLVRALGRLPGGLDRFLPCQVGTHLSRLRHLGWNQCSHGLTSRPLESCHHRCLSAVCGILG